MFELDSNEIKGELQDATSYALHAFCEGRDYEGGEVKSLYVHKVGDYVNIDAFFEKNGQVPLFSFKQTNNGLEINISPEVSKALFDSSMGRLDEHGMQEFLIDENVFLRDTIKAKNVFLSKKEKPD